MVLYPLLDIRGGASLCKPLEITGGFGVAPVIGVSGVATTGRIWAESQEIPFVVGGIRTGNLMLSNDVANRLSRRRRPNVDTRSRNLGKNRPQSTLQQNAQSMLSESMLWGLYDKIMILQKLLTLKRFLR